MIYLDNPRRRRRSRRRGKSLRGAPRDARGRLLPRGSRRRRARRRARRTYRRNPGQLAVYGLPNPRRRRGRRYRRTYRRNPGGLGRLLRGGYVAQLRRDLPDVGWAVAGTVATRIVPAQIARFAPNLVERFPVAWNYGSKLLSAIAVSRVIGMVAGSRAESAARLGGLLAVANEAASQYVLPMVGLGAYLEAPLGAYLDAPALGDYGSGATIPYELGDYGESRPARLAEGAARLGD